MIRVKIQYSDYFDEDGILQDGTQIVDTQNDKELLRVLKDVYNSKKVNHVHLEFGFYDKLHNFVYKGEIVVPFEKGIVPFVAL